MKEKELIEFATGLDQFVEAKQRAFNKENFFRIKSNFKKEKNKPLQGSDKVLINLCAILKILGISFNLIKIKKLNGNSIEKMKELIDHINQEN